MTDNQGVGARVLAFIRDHAEWERRMNLGSSGTSAPGCVDEVSTENEFPMHVQTIQQRHELAAQELKAIAGRHCVDSELLTRAGFRYGTPLLHDPACEEVTDCRIEAERAWVTTATAGGHVKNFEYELAQTRDGWRIAKILEFHGTTGPKPPTDWPAPKPPSGFSMHDDAGIDFRSAFIAGKAVHCRDTGRSEALIIATIGEALFPSGMIAVVDPGETFDPVVPFDLRLPVQRCAVEVARVGYYNAFVRLTFGDLEAVRAFVPARRIGDATESAAAKVSTRGGSILICDAAAWALLDGQSIERLYMKIVERPYSQVAEEAEVLSIPRTTIPAAVISRGGGDFDCTCYWAIDREGRAQALVIDLERCSNQIDRTMELAVTDRLFEATEPLAQLSEFGFDVRFAHEGDAIEVVSRGDQNPEVDLVDRDGSVVRSTEGAGAFSSGGNLVTRLEPVPVELSEMKLRLRWSTWAHALARDSSLEA